VQALPPHGSPNNQVSPCTWLPAADVNAAFPGMAQSQTAPNYVECFYANAGSTMLLHLEVMAADPGRLIQQRSMTEQVNEKLGRHVTYGKAPEFGPDAFTVVGPMVGGPAIAATVNWNEGSALCSLDVQVPAGSDDKAVLGKARELARLVYRNS
jgi:hypothetical protein